MLIDTHAHLDQHAFDADRSTVVDRAVAGGVEQLIAIGVTAESSADCVRLAAQYPAVSAAVGIQPNDVAEAQPGDWDKIAVLAEKPGVVALGETGLDRHWDFTPFEQQQDYFDRHLRLSQSSGLPFIVHMRDCGEDILEMLREASGRGPLSGVMHSFTGDAELAAECLALGLYISFAGMVTFKKSDELRAVAKTVPADRLLVETDCPYLSPEPVRKIRRNEPAHVAHTARLLADVRGESFADLAAQTTANAKRLFPLLP
ncbi:putative deoxyribonuclease YcfH [Posidoniimonas polymericola]|uniref:Putative deoxyribonuclease YcfH n=1 Tax=Posidoniimonas polymericola TaxID=2528002 RepID=A0A5C5YQD5_9BACT|nr:TatD family hydrolase [Posidoniimonas polymericola]TWT77008.1 putative deoxyribonuclease YcfH [Posidoniimonas polymericola]